MNSTDFRRREQETNNRVYDMLTSSFGTTIQELMRDSDVIEIMLNPDRRRSFVTHS
jgi:Flp pilus assembly CpaF family ATPase